MNWARNVRYRTDAVEYPTSADEVRRLVQKHDRLKVLGSRHCFNRIGDSADRFLSLSRLNKIVSLDRHSRQVTVEAGTTYGELSRYLHEHGYALHNLGSLPHISVAGACATATHGSGAAQGNLATAVAGLEMVIASGDVVTLRASVDRERLNAAIVNLGALGVVTKLTLNIEPAFSMRQCVYLRLPLEELRENFDAIMSAGYSVSLFTDWLGPRLNQVWVKTRADRSPHAASDMERYGAMRAATNLHPIAEISPANCTEQMDVVGPWFERLPHFRMGFTPSSGDELQSEYFVPLRQAAEAIEALVRLGPLIGQSLLISEIRAVAADDLWMSPCYRQGCAAFHFTWKPDETAVMKLLPLIENELRPFKVRPHWGKLFCVGQPELDTQYERLPDFRREIVDYDARDKFTNPFLETYIHGA